MKQDTPERIKAEKHVNEVLRNHHEFLLRFAKDITAPEVFLALEARMKPSYDDMASEPHETGEADA